MSAHLRTWWHRPATTHLRSLLASWHPTGRAARLQRRVLARLSEELDHQPAPARPQRTGRHVAMPEIVQRGRTA